MQSQPEEEEDEQVGRFTTHLDDESAGKGLGVVFKTKAGGDTWPKIQRVDSGPVQAVTPQLRVGCTLISINGVPVDGMLFKDAAPMTKGRPLEFIWQEPLIEARWGEGQVGKLGIIFADTWPTVKKIAPDTLGAAVPGLQVGCKLLSINGIEVDGMPFKQAGQLVKARPLHLVFADKPDEAAAELARGRSTDLARERSRKRGGGVPAGPDQMVEPYFENPRPAAAAAGGAAAPADPEPEAAHAKGGQGGKGMVGQGGRHTPVGGGATGRGAGGAWQPAPVDPRHRGAGGGGGEGPLDAADDAQIAAGMNASLYHGGGKSPLFYDMCSFDS